MFLVLAVKGAITLADVNQIQKKIIFALVFLFLMKNKVTKTNMLVKYLPDI